MALTAVWPRSRNRTDASPSRSPNAPDVFNSGAEGRLRSPAEFVQAPSRATGSAHVEAAAAVPVSVSCAPIMIAAVLLVPLLMMMPETSSIFNSPPPVSDLRKIEEREGNVGASPQREG